MSGPSTRRRIKQEQQEGMASSSGASASAGGGGGSGFFDSLDILATIATQELKSKSDKVNNTEGIISIYIEHIKTTKECFLLQIHTKTLGGNT